jgi:hypothetical protein
MTGCAVAVLAGDTSEVSSKEGGVTEQLGKPPAITSVDNIYSSILQKSVVVPQWRSGKHRAAFVCSALRQEAMLGRQLSGPHVSRCASSRYLPSTSYPATFTVWQSEIAVVLGSGSRLPQYDLPTCFASPLTLGVTARRRQHPAALSPGTRIPYTRDCYMCKSELLGPN